MEKQIDFYFDLVSPYSYIASMLIDDVAHRVNAKVSWKPFLLGGVFKAVGTTEAPGLHPAKKPYLLKDLQRLSAHLKIPKRCLLIFLCAQFLPCAHCAVSMQMKFRRRHAHFIKPTGLITRTLLILKWWRPLLAGMQLSVQEYRKSRTHYFNLPKKQSNAGHLVHQHFL